ncbi:MAG: protein kinase [Planctomycetes bacterium]|nr:protein kinase [Planctomycetota bacterium]
MASTPHTDAGDPSSDAFHEALGDYLTRLERDGSGALEQFRQRHPEFAERLGRQLDWLAQHLADRRDDLPERIGPYRVLQRLGRGGMGEVFLAEQTTPFRRPVAVKVIARGPAEAARSARFAAEIQLLASLNHDGIARLFEAGSDAGRPYFTMEYVPGKPITDYCTEERLDLAARLRLFVRVCRAVEHAHRQGILHRDLKPSNVLVFGPRTDPTVKVIDFGLAKLLTVEPRAPGPLTESGQLVGTPDYMSPEQVGTAPQRPVDTRSDVYSLGVVLYELLTGVLPLSLWQARGLDLPALLHAIRERQPSSPSVRVEEGLADIARSPLPPGTMSPRRLRRLLAGDLDAIVMKALAKDMDARYGGVAQLADDVVRHLERRPVLARAPTWRYLLGTFVRRHRLAVGFAAVLLVVSFGFLITLNVLSQRSIRNLERAELFGLVHYLYQLRQRDEVPPPARAAALPALQAWLDEFDFVLAQRDRMRAFVLAPAVATTPAPNGGWTTGEQAQAALRESLVQALAVLDAMTAPAGERNRMLARIDWAQRVDGATVEAHRAAWDRARLELAQDARFAGFELVPQPGLVPLGSDPVSGLQEFALPLPGLEVPTRGPGGLGSGANGCPVFVLLPGGTVTVGSQNDAPDASRYDAGRRPFEPDLDEVALEPFFAGKHELTNAQWAAIAPGRHAPLEELAGPRQPAVEVTDASMLHALLAWGMRLPIDAEWEYLARGGTDTPWWCGAAAACLQSCANLHDGAVTAARIGGEGEAVPWSDGFAVTAPVGSFAANGFGLFDVHGNANEVVVRVADDGVEELDLRGGSWHQGAGAARVTSRVWWDGRALPSIGCRPVVSLRR